MCITDMQKINAMHFTWFNYAAECFCLKRAYGLPIVGIGHCGLKYARQDKILDQAATCFFYPTAAKSIGWQPRFIHPKENTKLAATLSASRNTPGLNFYFKPNIKSSSRIAGTGRKGSFMNMCFMHPASCVISALHAAGSDNIGRR